MNENNINNMMGQTPQESFMTNEQIKASEIPIPKESMSNPNSMVGQNINMTAPLENSNNANNIMGQNQNIVRETSSDMDVKTKLENLAREVQQFTAISNRQFEETKKEEELEDLEYSKIDTIDDNNMMIDRESDDSEEELAMENEEYEEMSVSTISEDDPNVSVDDLNDIF